MRGVDKLSTEQRSANMARIRSKDTHPELVLRSLIHGLGYRFRLHRKDLPGKPDIVFPGRRKIIFAHGCFWHQHPGCPEGRVPGSRLEYWAPKLTKNQSRDAANQSHLKDEGWDLLVIWECELKDISAVKRKVRDFLGSPAHNSGGKKRQI
jgi:DNA mismatch endonuclease (patch repair protein)